MSKMNRVLLVFALNQLLIQKGSPEENLNARGKNTLHLERLLKRKLKKIENKYSFNIHLILN